MENKEKYVPADLEIVSFETEDIITTSGVGGTDMPDQPFDE